MFFISFDSFRDSFILYSVIFVKSSSNASFMGEFESKLLIEKEGLLSFSYIGFLSNNIGDVVRLSAETNFLIDYLWLVNYVLV
jgi:hypothetical protein